MRSISDVTSDTDSIADVWAEHHYAKNAAEASCLGVKVGGCDVDSGNTYKTGLLAGVAAGGCSMADVDTALYNTMRIRFELGCGRNFDIILDPVSRRFQLYATPHAPCAMRVAT